jgi:hypothetical protein
MKNEIILKTAVCLLVVCFSASGIADDNNTSKQPILKNKTTNPNYDPNKGILGKPKEEKVIKRTRNEPVLKNRKYEPIINKNK